MIAKKEETHERRLKQLIESSENGMRVGVIPQRTRKYKAVMTQAKLLICTILALAITTLAAHVAISQTQPKPTDTPDVVRTETNLVQTGISVVDKKGNFVDGLRLEQFQLSVDGKPQPISFLSRVTTGTTNERRQLAAAGSSNKLASEPDTEPDEEGRIIIFFIDDLHLSPGSVQRTRQTILNFLTNQMGPRDQAAIASASGQIGFLQQFTENRAVLRAAVARLNHRPYTVVDTEAVPMTEYTALRVEQGDRDAITYYTNQLLLQNNFRSPGGPLGPPAGGAMNQRPAQQRSSGLSREMAERMVRERALVMLKQAGAVTTNTLLGLESLMRSSSRYSGRKLLFLMSDGFYLNDRNTGFGNKLKEITDAAVRAGVVIYSLDTRGLVSNIDVSSNRADPEGKLSRANVGELTASQDGLNALAEDTGGRALFDSDGLSERVGQVMAESANYYLLSWRPAREEQKSVNFKRIEISVIGRPELTVRRPKGYLGSPVPQLTSLPSSSTTTPDPKTSIDADLKGALSAATPSDGIPLMAGASFLDTPDNGLLLTASVQAATATLDYGNDGKQAAVNIAGVVLNDQGKATASFKTRLTVNSLPANINQTDNGVVYNYKTKVTPGLYQIRTAVKDEKSGKVGSATQWIEIPDLATRRLSLSTLLLRKSSTTETSKTETIELPFSVDRRFARTSQLSFFLFIYNATRGSQGTSPPDLTAQVEIFRRGKTIVATPVRRLSVEGMADLMRIPYAGQFPLASLPAGRYDLQVTITDRLSNTSTSQRVSFQID